MLPKNRHTFPFAAYITRHVCITYNERSRQIRQEDFLLAAAHATAAHDIKGQRVTIRTNKPHQPAGMACSLVPIKIWRKEIIF